MSSLAFHSPSSTVRVHGPERHYAGSLCRDFLLSLGVYHAYEHVGRPCELRPDTLSTQGVGLGISGYDLRAALDEQLMRERDERKDQ